MNEMQIFSNTEFGSIRTITIDGEPWFVGKDIAEALGYVNTRDALITHVDDEDKNTVVISDGKRGNPNQVVINESGVYALVFGSKLPSAKRFKHWVTSEVLPAIRKTGSYSKVPQCVPQRELTKDDYIKAASLVSGCKSERLPYVLGFLEQAGFEIPKVEQVHEEQMKEQSDGIDMKLLSDLISNSMMSLDALSRATDIPAGSLSRYKNKIHKPSPERYAILIQALS